MTPEDIPALQTVLVVDDEIGSQHALRRTLDEDFHVLTAGSADEARGLMERNEVAVVLCDQRMPGMSGVQFLEEVRERWPEVVRIIISGYADSEDIIAGINDAGIYQYVLKPWFPEQLLETVRGAAEIRKLQREVHGLDLELRTSKQVLRSHVETKRERVKAVFDFSRIVRSPGSPVDAVCDMAERVARFDISVLLLGESGSGKELLARAIHYTSARAGNAFVVENCGAIPDTLLESELFGHKRGSFTGANADYVGLFQRASGGSVFLDEIGDTSPAFQVKLLRVLQEGEVRPVGGARPIPVDVRIIAATHHNLEARVLDGSFREDLYYRLAGIILTMPPLRERRGDILPIARMLLEQAAAELGFDKRVFSADAEACLATYGWPGNIRELRNEIYRAVALTPPGEAEIAAQVLSARVMRGASQGMAMPNGHDALPQDGSLQQRLDAIEASLLREALLRCRWNKSLAAKELGLSRVGLRNKLLRFGLERKSES